MTIEKFYETLNLVVNLDRDLQLQSGLELINSTLGNLVSSPAHPTHQSSLASALATFSDAAEKLGEKLTPAQSSLIAEVGGEDFFDPLIAEKVQSSVSANAMTPSVARDFVQDLASRRSKFLTTVNQTLSGLTELGVRGAELTPGTADLAFVIPRDLFANQLATFAKELSFISRLIQHFNEAVTGETEHVELEGLSSSVPTVALLAKAQVVEAVANVVNKFLEAWEKIEKIRRIRGELKEIGLNGAATEELTEQITTTVNEVVEESTQLTLKSYPGEPGRRHELENALKQYTHRLFGQIERGLTVQFRSEPKPNDESVANKALEAVEQLSRKMQFPQIKADPILLTNGEILEGELHVKVTKRTTTTTTTTTKGQKRKDSPKE